MHTQHTGLFIFSISPSHRATTIMSAACHFITDADDYNIDVDDFDCDVDNCDIDADDCDVKRLAGP